MDKDAAALILLACHRSANELASISSFLHDHGDEVDREALRLPVGRTICDIFDNIAGYVAAKCPEAQAEFERRYEKYGRAI